MVVQKKGECSEVVHLGEEEDGFSCVLVMSEEPMVDLERNV